MISDRLSVTGGGAGQALASVVFSLVTVPFALCSLLLAFPALADTHYVDIASTNAHPPFTNWSTAATVIQDAVDQAETNDTVLVADGTYATGARVTPGYSLSNRVVITNSILVKSVNGPGVTIIQGQGPLGNGAVRCVFMASGTLAGFTLTNGYTMTSGDSRHDKGGGGAFSPSGTLNNCTLIGNSASYEGGGAHGGALNGCTLSANSAYYGGGTAHCNLTNCSLTGNSAGWAGGGAYMSVVNNSTLIANSAASGGGGAYYSTLNNCTLTANSASGGGGAAMSGLNNCIVYYNTAAVGPNYSFPDVSLSYCCTMPDPGDTGNITSEPGLVSPGHIAENSLCVGKGSSTYASGMDIDGESWRNPPSIGCDEPLAEALTGSLSVAILPQSLDAATYTTVGFTGLFRGRCASNEWSFGDGTALTNEIYPNHAWLAPGDYAVVLRSFNEDNLQGVAATVTIHVVSAEVTAKYVWTNSPTPAYPYDSWSNAAHTLQAAVDAQTISGGWVWATDGVYSTGMKVTPGYSLSNRVVITNSILVKSVNGPGVTIIQGQGPLGNGAVRCVFMASGTLTGFTLTNGFTMTSGDLGHDRSGGGACASGCTLSNCRIVGNSASTWGGGAHAGMLNDCTLSGNSAAVGGGACDATLYNCRFSGNSATAGGGGAAGCILNNCALSDNAVTGPNGRGGGADSSTLNNCTVFGNSATGQYSSGGGTHACWLNNCIVYYNTAPTGTNCEGGSLSYCCTSPDPGGTNNITSEPLFESLGVGNYRLQAMSPCIDRGINQAWMFGSADLAGNPRIRNGTVDMGAYEFAFNADLRGLLQGPYDTNAHAMTSLLNTSIPIAAPYADDHRTVSGMPSNVVDWVLVEVRDTNANTIMSRGVFLGRDGHLMTENGSTGIAVEASTGCYNLVLKHRNHLAVQSAQPVAFTNTLVSYDFTISSNRYFGGTNACVELEPGAWGMIAGDADGDGRITPVDRAIVSNQVGKTGYLQGDLNLDGKVDSSDQ